MVFFAGGLVDSQWLGGREMTPHAIDESRSKLVKHSF